MKSSKASAKSPSEPAMEGAAVTLLLVEDEDAMRELVGEYLKHAGYTVVAARDAEEAIRLATPMLDDIKMLVTDVNLPGMNGVQLARGLKAIIPGLRILYMSGHVANVALKDMAMGTTAFIAKPFSRQLFLDTLLSLLPDA